MFLTDLSSIGLWKDALANAGVFTSAFLLGSLVIAKFIGLSESESLKIDLVTWIFLSTTLGLALIAWITLPLGLLFPYETGFYRSGHAIFLLGAAIWWKHSVQAKIIRSLEAPPWRELSNWDKVLWPLIGLTVLYILFLSLHSIGGSDGQTLHLKAVSVWLDAHRYVPMITAYDGLPHTVGDHQTHAGKLLFLHVALVGSIYGAGAFNVMLIGLGCLGVYALALRWFSFKIGITAVLVYLTNPVLFRYYAWDVTDYPLNLAVFLAVCVVLSLAIRSVQSRWLVITAILGGLLYGIKAYAVLQLALLAVIALPFLHLRGWLGPAIRQLPWFGLFAAPWLIHHWIVFGNPVWPHFNALFAGRPLNPFWQLFSATRPYFMLQPYFDAGATTYTAALMQFWKNQLFPSTQSVFFFSVFLVPSIAAFAIGAYWRRILLIPLVFALGFLAVTLNSPQLFNKYMILIAAPTAPFLAYTIQWVFGRREKWLSVVSFSVGLYVLLTMWDAVSLYNRNGEMFTHAANARSAEPQRTLNLLPQSAVVFGNFVGVDNRYTRIYWQFRYISDTSELLCDDWESMWNYYKRQGVTHYLVQSSEYDEYWLGAVLPYVDKLDHGLADMIRTRSVIFARNKEARNKYLASNARAMPLGGGYVLYEIIQH